MADLIDRQAVNDVFVKLQQDCFTNGHLNEWFYLVQVAKEVVKIPSAEPKIIRCKDCRWWDKYGDYDNGYCMAARHGYYSEHWEINIRRTYKGDFYCADAEPKEEQE